MTSELAVPSTIDDATAQWLTTVLGATVTGLRAERIAQESGFSLLAGLPYLMVLPVITLNGWDTMPERSRALCLRLTERAVATIDDIGALEVFRVTRTAREVVELYNNVVWNKRDFALADELMGDTVIRHEVGESHTLTHEQAVNRVVDTWELFDELRFDLLLVSAGDDGEHVTIVYESPMTLKDGTETTIGSMEVFRVVDGRITEVWNCGYKQGVWQ